MATLARRIAEEIISKNEADAFLFTTQPEYQEMIAWGNIRRAVLQKVDALRPETLTVLIWNAPMDYHRFLPCARPLAGAVPSDSVTYPGRRMLRQHAASALLEEIRVLCEARIDLSGA